MEFVSFYFVCYIIYMRHFFLVPKMDRAASGEKLFELTWWEHFSADKIQTKVFDINDNKNQQGSEEISSTTLYKWKKGINLPDIYKLIRFSHFFHKHIEELFVFNYSYIEIKKKIKSKHKSGTEIHSRIQTMYFEEEDLTIEELKEKYLRDFEDFEYENQYGYTLTNDYPFYYELPDINMLKPIIDLDIIKDNFSSILKLFEKKYGSINSYLTTLLGIKNSATITNWKNTKTIPETETFLTILNFLQIPFHTIWVPIYIWNSKNDNFSHEEFSLLENYFFYINNHDNYLIPYCNFLQKNMDLVKKRNPEFTFQYEIFNKYPLDYLINLYLDDSESESNEDSLDLYMYQRFLFVEEDDDTDDLDDHPDYSPSINSICDDISHYLIYRIIKENKKDKYYDVILECFKTFSQSITMIREHSE